MFQTLSYQVRNEIAVLTLARPQLLNALDQESGLELVEALEKSGRDKGVRAVVLTGQGKAFSAGANVRAIRRYLEEHPGQGAAPFFYRVVDLLHRSILAIRQIPKPVIAAVNGVAAGGGLGWVLASDLVLAAPKARFDTAYIRIAVSPDAGNSFLLPRLVGPWKANELFFLGRVLTAEEAEAAGLVNLIVAEDELLNRALALAGEFKAMSAAALARTKSLMNSSFYQGLEAQMEKEREYILASAEEPDFEAAIMAFFKARAK
jgi:2-(1,2-epoxy-1,2-dihydrophenyl)acetyl-CoA isomerase